MTLNKFALALLGASAFTALGAAQAFAQEPAEAGAVSDVRPIDETTANNEFLQAQVESLQALPLDDGIADRVVEAVGNGARTGRIGDGKVFVLDLEGAMRVRTGEMGADAL